MNSPVDGSDTRQPRITIRGTVTPSGASVKVSGRDAQVENGVFTASIPLRGGTNDIDVVASGPDLTPDSTTIPVTRKSTRAKTRVVDNASATAASPDNDSPSKAFYAGSGNVNCTISASQAACSVVSAGETFVVGDSGRGRIESGARYGRASGNYQPYGSTVSAGDFTCSIPAESSPRGITCTNSSTGHGFEASRKSARQKLF